MCLQTRSVADVFSVSHVSKPSNTNSNETLARKNRGQRLFLLCLRAWSTLKYWFSSNRCERIEDCSKSYASKVCPCVARMISWVPSIGSPPTPCRRRGHNDSDTMPTHVHTRSENCASFQKEMILEKVHVELKPPSVAKGGKDKETRTSVDEPKHVFSRMLFMGTMVVPRTTFVIIIVSTLKPFPSPRSTVPSNIRTGPTDGDAFRGHKPTSHRGEHLSRTKRT